MREIDSRWIDRAAGLQVVWEIEEEGYTVRVEQCVRSPQGVEPFTNVYIGSDAEKAYDAYWHPFADPRVESPWAASVAPVADTQLIEA